MHLVLLLGRAGQNVRLSGTVRQRRFLGEGRLGADVARECKRRVSAAENPQLWVWPADVALRTVHENLDKQLGMSHGGRMEAPDLKQIVKKFSLLQNHSEKAHI